MLTKTTTATTASDYRLTNFSYECTCGESHVFTRLSETKKCKCGRIVQLSGQMRQTLIANGSAKPMD
jgi:predicted SprT family Zn-dependent metalloprotease